MFSKQTLSSKAAILGLLILLVFLGNLKFQQWQNQKQINSQEQGLQQQADALQKKNDQLNQSLATLNSQEFKEKVAREELGYKLNGETVYGFSDPAGSGTQTQNAVSQISNASKWWDYFFKD